jgi:exonuclease III
MNLLSWNCRGLGQPRTVQELIRLVRDHCPSIVFVSETRQQSYRVTNIKSQLGMNNCFTVDGQGKGGGLALYWKDSIMMDFLSYGLHHIDTSVWDGTHHAGWRGTFVYGEPNTQHRHDMWELIRRMKPRSQAHWLMIGYFNEAMWSHEHISARKRLERQLLDFREILSQCDLHDLGFSGKSWTCDNKQAGERNVRVRLDRVVANLGWTSWFPKASLVHIVSPRSNHCPILLHLERDEEDTAPQRIHRYEVM